MKGSIQILGILFLVSVGNAQVAADSTQNKVTALALGSASTIHQVLSRADVALVKSAIRPNLVKGEFGEAVHARSVGRYFQQTGNWQQVSPRLGPQGLDHVFVKMDSYDRPRGLLVDETKYGSSRLAKTTNGDVQIGKTWTDKRVAGLASRYRNLIRQIDQGIQVKTRPSNLSNHQQLRVPLGNSSKEIYFWRFNSSQPWNYDGPRTELSQVRRQLSRLEIYFDAAAEGRISYARRVAQVQFKNGELHLTLRDASNVDQVNGSIRKLPVTGRVVIPMAGNSWASKEMVSQVRKEIQRTLPHLSKQDVARLVERLRAKSGSPEDVLGARSYASSTLSAAVKGATLGAFIAGPLDAGMQWWFTGLVDWERVGKTTLIGATAGGAGAAAGYGISRLLLKSPAGYSLARSAATVLGMGSAGKFTLLAAGGAAGGVASAVFSYGMWMMGEMDLRTANRSFVAGTVGSLVGVGASAATMTIISAYGVAGTGTAISTLSGVAATNASLAYLGGGTVVSGGLGTTGGLVVLTGGGVILVIAAAAVVWAGFSMYDSAQDNELIGRTLDYMMNRYSGA